MVQQGEHRKALNAGSTDPVPSPERCAAGMRVIGVTTTLSPGDMAAVGPDNVFADISRIAVPDITGLRLREGALAAPQV